MHSQVKFYVVPYSWIGDNGPLQFSAELQPTDFNSAVYR